MENSGKSAMDALPELGGLPDFGVVAHGGNNTSAYGPPLAPLTENTWRAILWIPAPCLVRVASSYLTMPHNTS